MRALCCSRMAVSSSSLICGCVYFEVRKYYSFLCKNLQWIVRVSGLGRFGLTCVRGSGSQVGAWIAPSQPGFVDIPVNKGWSGFGCGVLIFLRKSEGSLTCRRSENLRLSLLYFSALTEQAAFSSLAADSLFWPVSIFSPGLSRGSLAVGAAELCCRGSWVLGLLVSACCSRGISAKSEVFGLGMSWFWALAIIVFEVSKRESLSYN